MSAPDLLSVGEAFEDFIFVGLDRLPRLGEEVKTSVFFRSIGGGAVITAVAAARLGIRTRVVSGLSRDAVARLRREHVQVANLRRDGEPHALTASMSTRSNRAFVTFNGVNDALEERLPAALDGARTRHAHFAFFPRDCGRWERLVGVLRARGIGTSWDFGWSEALLADRRFPYLVNALDWVFFNEQEAVLYARRLHLDAALALWRAHPRNVVVKMGARGSRILSGGTELHAAPTRVRVVDTTGAGDAFNGGFLVGLLRGCSPRTCLQIGNFVGAMSCRVPGGIDGLPTRNGLPAALARRVGPAKTPGATRRPGR